MFLLSNKDSYCSFLSNLRVFDSTLSTLNKYPNQSLNESYQVVAKRSSLATDFKVVSRAQKLLYFAFTQVSDTEFQKICQSLLRNLKSFLSQGGHKAIKEKPITKEVELFLSTIAASINLQKDIGFFHLQYLEQKTQDFILSDAVLLNNQLSFLQFEQEFFINCCEQVMRNQPRRNYFKKLEDFKCTIQTQGPSDYFIFASSEIDSIPLNTNDLCFIIAVEHYLIELYSQRVPYDEQHFKWIYQEIIERLICYENKPQEKYFQFYLTRLLHQETTIATSIREEVMQRMAAIANSLSNMRDPNHNTFNKFSKILEQFSFFESATKELLNSIKLIEGIFKESEKLSKEIKDLQYDEYVRSGKQKECEQHRIESLRHQNEAINTLDRFVQQYIGLKKEKIKSYSLLYPKLQKCVQLPGKEAPSVFESIFLSPDLQNSDRDHLVLPDTYVKRFQKFETLKNLATERDRMIESMRCKIVKKTQQAACMAKLQETITGAAENTSEIQLLCDDTTKASQDEKQEQKSESSVDELASKLQELHIVDKPSVDEILHVEEIESEQIVLKQEKTPPTSLVDEKKKEDGVDLKVSNHVWRWFDESQDPFIDDPHYRQMRASIEYKENIRRWHQVPLLIALLAKEKAPCFDFVHPETRKVFDAYAVGADIEMENGKTERGVCTFGFDKETQELCHSFFTKKPQNELMQEYIQQGYLRYDFPTLQVSQEKTMQSKKSYQIKLKKAQEVQEERIFTFSSRGTDVWTHDKQAIFHVFLF